MWEGQAAEQMMQAILTHYTEHPFPKDVQRFSFNVLIISDKVKGPSTSLCMSNRFSSQASLPKTDTTITRVSVHIPEIQEPKHWNFLDGDEAGPKKPDYLILINSHASAQLPVTMDICAQGFKRETNRAGEDLCPRRFRRANCSLQCRGAGLADAGEWSSGPRSAGCGSRAPASADPRGLRGADRVSSEDSPGHVGSGQPPPPPLAPPPALSSSAFAPRHGRAARACPSRRSPGGRFNPAQLRPPPREHPQWLPLPPPPGPRAASPVQSEEVEESRRVSPKTRNPASRGARPPALPPPLPPSPPPPPPPPPLPGPSSWPF
ncbi:uncharacterized protein [Odocoileus virginianus]|uniref:Uncharacterized protein n=1 Tax=Odocoileus virginianus TaxID=9874 RepID=A0ABM4J873_ODOVR